MRDYYYILGIEQNASVQEIKTAYRKLSMKFHPDKNNGEKFFEDRFKEIQEAYETLSDESKKGHYDFIHGQFKSNRANQNNFENYEQELKRRFEEELRKREEEIRRNFQSREKKIKEEFAGKKSTKSNEQKVSPVQEKNSSIISLYLFLALVIVVVVFLAIRVTNSLDPTQGQTEVATLDSPDIQSLIDRWNNAHSTKDRQEFSNLFANSILFYGEQTDKNTCIEKKFSFFRKYPDFYQQIVGDIEIKEISSEEFTCNFLKRVTVNQKTNDYPSYLTFRKLDEHWWIIIEGDLVTDRNLAMKKENAIPANAVKGDFDGDGTTEYVWLVPPNFPKGQNESNFGECDGECECYLKFSNDKMPSIRLKSCIGGVPVKEGDLNDDGADEVGILPSWWTSCWRSYEVFTLRNNEWKFIVEPFSTHCNQWDKGVDAIEKDNSKSGNVIIRYSFHTGDDIVTLTKSIPAER